MRKPDRILQRATARRTTNGLAAVAVAAALTALAPPVAAQAAMQLAAHPAAQPAAEHAFLSAPEVRDSQVLARGGYAVVVDLDENELHFVHGRTVLWSAPVATGMGLRLESARRSWDFSTPTGVYQVEFKAENPVWYAPDWYFIENKLPVPPQNDPRRRFPGGLGAAAVYIGHGLAIHGTDKPDLLGQRVSHGCIRLSNDDAQRLFHNVQIGTEVLIVGSEPQEARGRLVPGRVPGTGPVDARTERLRQRAKAERERRLARLAAAPLDTLAVRLRAELSARGSADAAWTHLAGELVRRAVEARDAEAARVLLEAANTARSARVQTEYATYLSDLSERGASAMIRALSELDPRARQRAASAIVGATAGLYHGSPADPVVPCPTSPRPASSLEDSSAAGFAALSAAERAYREAYLAERVPAAAR
jgi:hypothetical protein